MDDGLTDAANRKDAGFWGGLNELKLISIATENDCRAYVCKSSKCLSNEKYEHKYLD